MTTSILANESGKVFDALEIKETFIFPNQSGHITLKQSRGLADEDDVIVVIPIDQVENVVRALRRAKTDVVG